MQVVIQRVKDSSVSIGDEPICKIGVGILVFLGIEKEDTQNDADYLVSKITNLRIFDDSYGKMNLSVKDINGEILVISQFTILGDCRKGRRPSFANAAAPEKAETLYQYFVSQIKNDNITVSTGKFQAKMDVSILNYGPATFILDSKNKVLKEDRL